MAVIFPVLQLNASNKISKTRMKTNVARKDALGALICLTGSHGVIIPKIWKFLGKTVMIAIA